MENLNQREKHDAKFCLRLPTRIKEAVQKKAAEEGLSINSAIIQRLVWSLQNDKSKAR
jgi:predicted HicB family RNase H-like nuclease